MDEIKLKKYNILFERMVDAMTNPTRFDRDEFVAVLKDICELFNLSKGVTEFYRSLSAEKAGDGEILVDYDNGRGDKVAIFRRIVTPSLTVVKSTIYMPEDAEPLTDEEYRKLDLILRAMLSFISRNRLQTVVEKIAFYDEFGYPNLSSFLRHLEMMNEKGTLHGNTVVHFNLRNFSLINQEIGRTAADVVMQRYFDQIRTLLGEDGFICRIGGDNFIAILKNELLKSVLFVLEGFPILYDEERQKRVMISACVGVFVIPDDYDLDRPGEIMGKVYPATQEAKTGNSGNVVYYSDDMNVRKEQNMRVRMLFSHGMANNEFRAFYQPKVDVQTGRIVGAEALCRWIREGKIVSPAEFIPVLEQTTDICRLDFRMLDMVCKDIRRWLDEGRNVVRVSVNLSRKHLIDVDLHEHIMKIINENHVPHQYIELELTETTTDVEFRDLKRVVGGLRMEGIYTTVDDFGMGYSSLNLIREVPWDVLKLDRSFLPTEKDDSGVAELMFSHVVSMAQAMGLECVAEGVETIEQLNLLKSNNCNIAQGFFFDKPLPAEEFEERLDRRSYDIDSMK